GDGGRRRGLRTRAQRRPHGPGAATALATAQAKKRASGAGTVPAATRPPPRVPWSPARIRTPRPSGPGRTPCDGIAAGNGVRGLRGLAGGFAQRVLVGAGRARQSCGGRVALAGGRVFRWESRVPRPRLVGAGGTPVAVDDRDVEQVTRRPQGGAEQDSPFAEL